MKTLPEIQSKFFNAVIDNSDVFTAEVIQQGEMTADERVAIYVDGYRLRLIEALQDSYSALHTLMGDEDFENLCLEYIDANPSTHFSIRYFGHRLDEFLQENNQNGNTDLLQEMAKFEWALRAAFDAKDVSCLILDDLSQLTPEEWPELKFELHPSLRMLSLNWNIPMLWQAIEQEAEPQPPQNNLDSLTWIIWRPELGTHFRSMNEDEAAAFRRVKQGETFGQLCEAVAETIAPEQAAQHAAGYLARWLEEGLLVSFSTH